MSGRTPKLDGTSVCAIALAYNDNPHMSMSNVLSMIKHQAKLTWFRFNGFDIQEQDVDQNILNNFHVSKRTLNRYAKRYWRSPNADL